MLQGGDFSNSPPPEMTNRQMTKGSWHKDCHVTPKIWRLPLRLLTSLFCQNGLLGVFDTVMSCMEEVEKHTRNSLRRKGRAALRHDPDLKSRRGSVSRFGKAFFGGPTPKQFSAKILISGWGSKKRLSLAADLSPDSRTRPEEFRTFYYVWPGAKAARWEKIK